MTCEYNFDQNANCDATYSLHQGTIFAAGGFNFNAKEFTLAITGGVGSFVGLKGEVVESPGAKHAQHVAFVLESG